MAGIARTQSADALVGRNFFLLTLTGALVTIGSCASSALAQTAQQSSAGMQITLPASASSQAVAPAKNQEDDAQDKLLAQAVQMIKSRQANEALTGPIAQVIAYYENGVGKDHSQRHYCARSPVEVLLYMAEAAKDHQSAVAFSQTWADSYFYESSALTDLGRNGESQAALRKALQLSPWNSLYLSELGYTYEMQHDFDKALETYQQAEAATNFSPEKMKNLELGRALQGQGYALTELHRFDDAEAKYHEALKLDPNDQKSKGELEYIKSARARSGSNQGA